MRGQPPLRGRSNTGLTPTLGALDSQKDTPMPMIDITLRKGSLDEATTLASLTICSRRCCVGKAHPTTNTLAHWPGRSSTPSTSIRVASSPSGKPHFRIAVTTPQGALDDVRRAGLVAEVTELGCARSRRTEHSRKTHSTCGSSSTRSTRAVGARRRIIWRFRGHHQLRQSMITGACQR